jgi:FkbM family methyltransferase
VLDLLSRPFRLIEAGFPRSRAIRAVVEKLSFVHSSYGVLLFNSPGDRTFELCVKGYGSFISDVIAGYDEEFTFLDVGANLGLFSLLAAKNPNCRRVLAIEPAPIIFRNLEANLRRNGAGIVKTVMGAVTSSPDAMVFLSYSPRHSGMSRITTRNATAIPVPSISAAQLNSLVPRSTTAIVAKIDVEGSELDVLSTLRKTHFNDRIVEVIIEVSERNLGSDRRDELLWLLEEDGYRELSRAGPAEHYDAQYRKMANRTRPSGAERWAP